MVYAGVWIQALNYYDMKRFLNIANAILITRITGIFYAITSLIGGNTDGHVIT